MGRGFQIFPLFPAPEIVDEHAFGMTSIISRLNIIFIIG